MEPFVSRRSDAQIHHDRGGSRRRHPGRYGAGAGALASPADHGNGHGHHAAKHHGRSAIDHIYVIMLENHSKSSVIDNANAPYITKLAHRQSRGGHVDHTSYNHYSC